VTGIDYHTETGFSNLKNRDVINLYKVGEKRSC